MLSDEKLAEIIADGCLDNLLRRFMRSHSRFKSLNHHRKTESLLDDKTVTRDFEATLKTRDRVWAVDMTKEMSIGLEADLNTYPDHWKWIEVYCRFENEGTKVVYGYKLKLNERG